MVYGDVPEKEVDFTRRDGAEKACPNEFEEKEGIDKMKARC